MMIPCEQVAERVALGEALGELSEHVASCERCTRVVAMPGALGATHREVDPGLGFSARMTVGAQQRIAVRYRRRLAVGLAATVAAGALGVFFVTHAQRTDGREQDVPATTAQREQPSDPEEQPLDDADLKALVDLADVDHNAHVTARWRHIEKPLAPYKKLVAGELEGETP